MKLAYILIVYSAIWMSVTFAQDQRCVGREDGMSCSCGNGNTGTCVGRFCMCDPVRRKRSSCSRDSHCRWCNGYCAGGSCVCLA